jgi:hypothetical protein
MKTQKLNLGKWRSNADGRTCEVALEDATTKPAEKPANCKSQAVASRRLWRSDTGGPRYNRVWLKSTPFWRSMLRGGYMWA